MNTQCKSECVFIIAEANQNKTAHFPNNTVMSPENVHAWVQITPVNDLPACEWNCMDSNTVKMTTMFECGLFQFVFVFLVMWIFYFSFS